MPKALKRFTSIEIEFCLDSGEWPKGFEEILEEGLLAARNSVDGEAGVQFFIDATDEELEVEEDEDESSDIEESSEKKAE